MSEKPTWIISPEEYKHMTAPGGPADIMRKKENMMFWGVEDPSTLFKTRKPMKHIPNAISLFAAAILTALTYAGFHWGWQHMRTTEPWHQNYGWWVIFFLLIFAGVRFSIYLRGIKFDEEEDLF